MKTLVTTCLILVCVLFCDSKVIINNCKECTTQACNNAAQEIKSYMDDSVDPCQDFAGYVCGGFYKKEKIPDDLDTWNDRVKVERKTQEYFKSILEETVDLDDPEYLQKMKKFYQLCMDEDTIDKVGYSDFQNSDYKKLWPTLNKDYDPKSFDMNKLMEVFEKQVVKSVFYYHVWTNKTDSSQMNMEINIRPRHFNFVYSVNNDHVKVENLGEYYHHVAVVLGADLKTAKKDAVDYTALDFLLGYKIAKPGNLDSITDVKPNTPLTLADMNKEFPFIDWVRAFKAVFHSTDKEIDESFEVNVAQPLALKLISDFISKTKDKRTVQNWVAFSYVVKAYEGTTRRMRELKQKYMPDALGSKKQPARWRQCVDEVNKYYSEALAVRFSDKLPKNIKSKVEEIVVPLKEYIQFAPGTSDFQDDSIEKAERKVANMNVRIAYPDHMTDDRLNKIYEKYQIYDGKYAKTRLQNEREWNLNFLTRAGESRDKDEWLYGHTSFGRGYDALGNILSIAGVKLQPPFYVDGYPSFLKFGSLGPLIDITSVYDPKGIKYDENGNRGDLLTHNDQKTYSSMVNCFQNQYSQYEIKSISKHINGQQTSRSNINDNLNLQATWENHYSSRPEYKLPDLDLTEDKLFFIAWAKNFCTLETKERTQHAQLVSSKSYDRYRIIGSVQNHPRFSGIFNCERNSPMNPDLKCPLIWQNIL